MATYSKVCSNVGSFTFGDRFTLYVVLTNRDGNPSTNKSVVDYNVYFQNTSGGGTFTSRTRLYFALNGGVIKDTTSEITGPRNGSVTVASGSTTIDHNNDGTKSISYHALVQSATFGINGEISGTFTLNTIPRASSVSGGSGNIAGTTTISVSRASTSFTHTLRYAFGSLSGTIATGVGTSYTWTIPTSFYAQIPDAKTGTGTIYCDTYNGTTLIGTKSTQFTATVTEASSRPTVSATLTDTNATTKALTGNASKMVKGKSTGQLVITSSVKNSATIKSVTVNGTNVGTAASITKTYANISTASFTIVTTDSRGFTNTSYVVTPSYVNYVPLTLNTTIFRPQPTGTEIQMTYSGNYFNGSFGSVANTLSITWKYRVQGASSWTNGGTIMPTLSGNTISSKTISLGTSYDYQTAYDFQITAVDKLTTNTQTIAVSVGMPVFYWGKNFFNVNFDTKIRGKINENNFGSYTIDGNYKTAYRTQTKGDSSTGGYISTIRNDTASVDGAPQYGSGLAWGRFDTHGYLYVPYANTQKALIVGAGNADKLNWVARVPIRVDLYHNLSGNSGTVTLSESSANFDYIEIFFTDNNKNKYNSVKVFSPNGKNVDLHLIGGWTDGTNALTDIRSKRMTISETSLAISSSGGNLTYSYLNISAKNILQHEYSNYIYITKVTGYR